MAEKVQNIQATWSECFFFFFESAHHVPGVWECACICDFRTLSGMSESKGPEGLNFPLLLTVAAPSPMFSRIPRRANSRLHPEIKPQPFLLSVLSLKRSKKKKKKNPRIHS